MKSTTILALSAATLAAAQGNSSLAQCGQNCINDLIGIMQKPKYNCPNNPTCFCCQPDFGFGIRDCANQACGSNSGDANSAIAYAASYCASALPTESTSACAAFSSGASSTTIGASSATPTGSGSGSSGSSSPQQTGAPGFIVALANGASGYSIGSTTATAGGPEVTASGTEYSALPSDAGIVATASGVTTTIPPSALTGGAAGASGSASSSGSGSGAGAAGFIVPVNDGTSGYSIASTTITAGGPEATLSNTEYSALPSAGGVVATASGLTTTYAESQLGGAAGATGSSSGAATSPASSSGSGAGGAGGAGSSSTRPASSTSGGSGASSSTSGGAGAMITAAPVMIGAAALAVLAL